MNKTELTEWMRKNNFGELFRMYAHSVKANELFEPYEDLATEGSATVQLTIEHGGLTVVKAEPVIVETDVSNYESEIKSLKATVKEQKQTIQTLQEAEETEEEVVAEEEQVVTPKKRRKTT